MLLKSYDFIVGKQRPIRAKNGLDAVEKPGPGFFEFFRHVKMLTSNENVKMDLPCLPTISATCSELGTGTHSVMFCDFFDLTSSMPTFAKGLTKEDRSPGLSGSGTVLRGSLKPNMVSSRANWSALSSPIPVLRPMS